jgi:hydrogenase maturation protease
MNLAHLDQIARAVLYEGYMLYPYRLSSVKNRQRFNFGVLYPPDCENQSGNEPSSLRVECLVAGNPETTIETRVRFLHLLVGETSNASGSSNDTARSWQEAAEREVTLPSFSLSLAARSPVRHDFSFPAGCDCQTQDSGRIRRQQAIQGTVEASAEWLRESLFKLTTLVSNTTRFEVRDGGRDEALLRSLVSAHVILGVENGSFISLLETPDSLRDAAGQCQNSGVWPVLVGDPGQTDTLLASPIILYDYPQIAPESAGDLFDGTEIDEILSLRIMTLTDEEKQEIRNSDQRARQILERTDSLSPEQFMKLHGIVRGLRPLKEDPA